jgi:DNA-binding NarL/FixJ family response regulator
MMTQRSEKIAVRPAQLDHEAPEVTWVKCSNPEVALRLEATLKAVGYDVYCGQEAPGKDVCSSIYWPNGEEEVGSEMRRLRAHSQDAPVLALRAGVDPQLILTALRAGARGFVGIRPSRIIRALSTAAASRYGIVMARELLEALLVERASREDCLAPYQQEILFEVATVAACSGGDPLFPRKLLEAFLVEVMMA